MASTTAETSAATVSVAPDAAIEASNLSKRYHLGEHRSLTRTLRTFVRRAPATPDEFVALDEVTFAIARGECFGIVGHNGSGKSTILQIIAGITLPTEGSMVVRGRVLPLLAVGSGFHPELTGRENVVLFGTVLGLRPSVIATQLPAIAAFADVERHIDTPIKRYSDGMAARLSFAIAMRFPADIYLFDEVLSVVDGEFRDTCLAEIGRLAIQGRTVIFISHAEEQVRSLCRRVMWIDQGRVQCVGPSVEVLPAYAHAHPD